MKKALALAGLIAALGMGCSKDTTKNDNGAAPKNDNTVKSNNAVVEYKEYKDGYEKNIKNSPYGRLHGEYLNTVHSPFDAKVRIIIQDNDILEYILDQEDDGKADRIRLERYLDGSRTNRVDHPYEFGLADEILKYWKETK